MRRFEQIEVLAGGVLTLGEDRPVLPDAPSRSSTTAWVDPGRDVAAVLLTSRGFAGPEDELRDF